MNCLAGFDTKHFSSRRVGKAVTSPRPTHRSVPVATAGSSPEPHRPAAVFFGGMAMLLVWVLAMSGMLVVDDMEPPLTQNQILAQTQYCRLHHQQAVAYTRGDNHIRAIRCRASL